MTYDMHGGWDATGPTNHQAPLYASPNDPMTPVPPGNEKYNVDAAVKAWTTGDSSYGIPGGFPANKITIGYPFYYRGWTGVPAGGNNGLYQSATAPAPGNPLSGNVPGVSMYKEIRDFVTNPSNTYCDETTKASYFYDGTTSGRATTSASIQARADYLHCKGLAGAMMFSLETSTRPPRCSTTSSTRPTAPRPAASDRARRVARPPARPSVRP